MFSTSVGIAGIVILFVLLAIGLHLGAAFILVGGVGLILLMGWRGALNIIGSAPFAFASSYNLSPLPLFLLMGAFAESGGFGATVFEAVSKWAGKIPGALAVASTMGNAFFGVASGSSLAATAIFARVALPQMLRRNYNKSLAAGCIACAGTFSTMIPPSAGLMLYAILTEQPIAIVFMAGLVPGSITALVYTASIIIRAVRNPKLAPIISESYTWRTKVHSTLDIWPIIALGFLVLGGILLGWFTATEAGAVGALGALIIAMILRGVRGARIPRALMTCMKTVGMIFLIIIGAIIFARFLSVTQIPTHLASFLSGLALPRVAILAGFLLMYFVLGMFMGPLEIMVITIPVVIPVIIHLGYNPIWFGIVLTKMCEIGLVTPPVGPNVFVVSAASDGQVSLIDAFKGVVPFIICDLFVLVLLVAFPDIVLFLPNLIFKS